MKLEYQEANPSKRLKLEGQIPSSGYAKKSQIKP